MDFTHFVVALNTKWFWYKYKELFGKPWQLVKLSFSPSLYLTLTYFSCHMGLSSSFELDLSKLIRLNSHKFQATFFGTISKKTKKNKFIYNYSGWSIASAGS